MLNPYYRELFEKYQRQGLNKRGGYSDEGGCNIGNNTNILDEGGCNIRNNTNILDEGGCNIGNNINIFCECNIGNNTNMIY